jgi:hypothetical protein
MLIADMSVFPRTHISMQERKGRSESSVLHSADINQFCLRKSSSGSNVTVTVNCNLIIS